MKGRWKGVKKPPRRYTGGFLERWERKGKIAFEPNTGCWIWLGAGPPDGHGRVTATHLNERFAHRIAWIEHYGPIPDSLHVCHKCDTPPCINPQHLFLGTPLDNTRDAQKKDRLAKGERHGMSKLTTSDVLAIRNDNRTLEEIAASYGVRSPAISRIKQRKRWGWL